MNIETQKSRVSAVAVLIFACAIVTQCLTSYIETTTLKEVRLEMREELSSNEMNEIRRFDEEVEEEEEDGERDSKSYGEQSDDPQDSGSFGFLVLAIICAAGFYGAQQGKTEWLNFFSGCNLCHFMTGSCACGFVFLAVMCISLWVASSERVLQHCDVWELCPLTEDRTSDANGLVADLLTVDCLAKSAWPEYERQYPHFGTPPGRHCGHGSWAMLFLNCTAQATMTMAEVGQHENAFRSELVQMPAQVLAEDTTRWVGHLSERLSIQILQIRSSLPMPDNILDQCRADKGMMELFHHAKALVPEVWDTVWLQLWALSFLYFAGALLAGLGARWSWQLRKLLNESRRMGSGGRSPPAYAGSPPSYAQPLLQQPLLQNAAPQAPPRPPPQAPPQAPPQPTQPAGQFIVNCPEFTRPGQTIVVTNPATGQHVEVEVPDGVGSGQQFAVTM